MSPPDTIRKLLGRLAGEKSPAERRRLTRRLARLIDKAPAERDKLFTRQSEPTPGQGRFLLGLARRLSFPWPDPLLAAVAALLKRPDLSKRGRAAVAQKLSRSPHADARGIAPILRELLAQPEKPAVPAAECPRCRKRMPEAKLADHMLRAHRLAWDNGRPLDPWAAMRLWVSKFRADQNPATLDRAADLARKLEGPAGLDRLARLVASLNQGPDEQPSDDPRAPTICPACYAAIEPPNDFDPPRTIALSNDLEVGPFRLARRGGRLDITDHGKPAFGPARVAAPSGRSSRVLWLMLVAALALAALWPFGLGPPPVAACALVLALASAWYWLSARRATVGGRDEMAGLAWRHLAPDLARAELDWDAAGALAGLAALPAPVAGARERLTLLEGVSPAMRRLAATGTIPAGWLVPVAARECADLAASGGDPVPRLARAVGLCWSGQVPLSAAEALLSGAGFAEYQRLGRARLRVLLLKAAFEAGLYPNDIQELGRAVPALGSAVASEDVLGAARLRSLWSSERGGRSKELGAYWTCFDVAAAPAAGGSFLDAEPNLLMVQPPNDWLAAYPEVEAIRLTEEGVFCGVWELKSPQANIKVKNVGVMSGGYEVTAGGATDKVGSDPAWMVARLKAWQAYLFGKVLAGAVGQMQGDGDAAMARLMDQVQADCPECRTRVLRQPGGLGIPVVRAE